MAKNVANAVKLTDKAVFPFAKCVIKLEMFPPGQAATIIIPNAILGCGLISITNKKVNNGNKINCDNMPIKINFGRCKRSLKSLMVIDKATPNITTASAILRIQRPLLSKCI